MALPPDLSLGLAAERDVCFDCITQPPPLNNTWVAIDYAYPWAGLITQYKFANKPGWAPFFAQLLLQSPQVQSELALLDAGDLILPVPLSKERLHTRGFNQAWELACQLAKQSGTPGMLDPELLLRVKNTQPQTTLKRQARLDNVKGAFQVEPLRARALQGRRVVLVDDVMTSGASLFAAAQTLRSAGAAHIAGVVLARTPQ
jgi:ComF family protein